MGETGWLEHNVLAGFCIQVWDFFWISRMNPDVGRNIYMLGTTNVYSHAGEAVWSGSDRTPCIAKDMTIRVIKTRI